MQVCCFRFARDMSTLMLMPLYDRQHQVHIEGMGVTVLFATVAGNDLQYYSINKVLVMRTYPNPLSEGFAVVKAFVLSSSCTARCAYGRSQRASLCGQKIKNI